MKLLGIPVWEHPDAPLLAEARGFWPFQRIVVNQHFKRLSVAEQQAFLLHEVAHCKLRHRERRIARLWMIFQPKRLVDYCRNQELQADNFVRLMGYGAAMATGLAKLQGVGQSPQAIFYPPTHERIARLIACPSKE